MIWVAVFPTLTVLNLLLGGSLTGLPVVLRTFVLATIAVPIVIYGVMPQLHRLRARLLAVPAATPVGRHHPLAGGHRRSGHSAVRAAVVGWSVRLITARRWRIRGTRDFRRDPHSHRELALRTGTAAAHEPPSRTAAASDPDPVGIRRTPAPSGPLRAPPHPTPQRRTTCWYVWLTGATAGGAWSWPPGSSPCWAPSPWPARSAASPGRTTCNRGRSRRPPPTPSRRRSRRPPVTPCRSWSTPRPASRRPMPARRRRRSSPTSRTTTTSWP